MTGSGSLTLLSSASKLPITALTFVETTKYILAGHGTRLLLIDAVSKAEQSWQVLNKNRIHVILPLFATEAKTTHVLVAGGKEVAWCRLLIDSPE